MSEVACDKKSVLPFSKGNIKNKIIEIEMFLILNFFLLLVTIHRNFEFVRNIVNIFKCVDPAKAE